MGSFDNSFNFDCVVGNRFFCLVCHFIFRPTYAVYGF